MYVYIIAIIGLCEYVICITFCKLQERYLCTSLGTPDIKYKCKNVPESFSLKFSPQGEGNSFTCLRIWVCMKSVRPGKHSRW